jgi:outer membrane cobalamin receptor
LCCAATQGTVVDPSGRPVRGARVECAGESVTTDEEGRFSVVGGRCSATVTAPGFSSAHVELNGGDARVELALAPLSERVVVSATRHETTVEEAGVSATVYTKQDLELRQAPNVADVLRDTPGLTIVRYGRPGSLTQMFARGGQRTGTLVMVDGVPVNDPGGEINLAGFSTNGLERVEVVRGPESALFGAEASSGVIQLFTVRGNPEDRFPRGSVTYERGSFQTDRVAANLAGGTGARMDYSLSGEQFHTVGEYQNDYFRNTTGTANVGVRLGASSQVRGIFRAFDSMLGAPNQVGYGIQDLDANEATRDYVAAVRLDDVRGRNYVQRLSFGYHRSWDLFTDPKADGPFDIAALVRDGNRRVYLERLLTSIPETIPAGTRLETRSVLLYASDPFLSLTSRKNVDYQGTLTHSGGAAVFGYEFERQRGDLSGNDIARDNHGFFLHEQRAIANRLFLSGGLRMEHNSAFGNKLTPRGAASLRVASSTFVRFSAGLGITEPSLLQNYARDPYFVGNPNLRPEKTTSYEAGVVREWFGRRLRTEAAAFHNSFRDLIVFVFLPFPAPSTWQNVETSRARGLEFNAQARIVAGLTASGNFTRMWSRITKSSSPNSLFTGVGQELPRRPGNSGAASLAYARGRFSAQAGALFAGERQDTDVFGVTRNPGYQDVYAGASMRVSRYLNPFLRVNNLLDQRYQEILGYPAQSRAINGGLRVQW